MDQPVSVPAPVMQALLRYLDRQPHGDVRGLIDALLAAARAPSAEAAQKMAAEAAELKAAAGDGAPE